VNGTHIMARIRLFLLAVMCWLCLVPAAHAIRPPSPAEEQLKEKTPCQEPLAYWSDARLDAEMRNGLFVRNNPLKYADPTGHAPIITSLTYDLKTGKSSAGYQEHQFGQEYGIGLHNPSGGPLNAVGTALQLADKAWNAGLDKITPAIDPNRNPYASAASQTARGMSLAGLETAATAGLGKLAGAVGKMANIGTSAENEMVTVTHFTDAATVAKIQNGTGTLNAGSFVTLPSEVAGMNVSQVETALEINAGKGAYSTTFQTPRANLGPAFNGPLTSGQKIQFQLINPTPSGPFVPTH
jgi:hypothetical protein